MITQRLGELEGCEQGSKQGLEGAWKHVGPAVQPLTTEQRPVQLRQGGARLTVSTSLTKSTPIIHFLAQALSQFPYSLPSSHTSYYTP